MNRNELHPDAVMKNYLRSNERFAALINYWLSTNQNIVTEDNIKELDTDVAATLSNHKSINRNRDIIKLVSIEDQSIGICIENQQTVDKNMVYRDMEYTILKYQSFKDNKEKPVPIITLVLYCGAKRWKRRSSLFANEEIPDIIKERFNNWNISVMDIKDISSELITNEDLRSFVGAVQELYRWDGESKLKDYQLTIETAIAVGAVTGTQAIIDQALENQKRGGIISMCQSVDRALANSRAKGIAAGIEQGLERGKKIERLSIVMRLLNNKFTNGLSNETIELINQSNSEYLDNIVSNIFEIETEEDIRKLLA